MNESYYEVTDLSKTDRRSSFTNLCRNAYRMTGLYLRSDLVTLVVIFFYFSLFKLCYRRGERHRLVIFEIRYIIKYLFSV